MILELVNKNITEKEKELKKKNAELKRRIAVLENNPIIDKESKWCSKIA